MGGGGFAPMKPACEANAEDGVVQGMSGGRRDDAQLQLGEDVGDVGLVEG